jgi:hypothetical protein
MKAITLAVAAVSVTGCLALSGCSSKAVAADCGKQTSNQEPVEIKVSSGPKVSNEECVVLPGSRIAWVNDQGNDVQFKLRFKTANPGGQGAPLKVPSQMQNGRFVVNITAGQLAPGEKERRFDYDIVANGTPLDPAIIIRK